ncbi:MULTISPECIES: DNA-methyltransferase [Enterobacteriaceae]|uniref:Methyltransferase n=1 Tax=Enterobacter roggenkampii TaxID=1812935 RepID=A0AAX1WJR2_9ENTR|nr:MULTISPECIES: site-specific DNA-methyltransferase [Enterobacteriaceae]EHF8257615.1 site-specific DNA-methyltransferase [Enterobacter roggenkampii]ELD8602147.1 site-specific DNA-methyltransferase [Enterobacter roggenkampii]MBE4868240.1 site-specific DNA-methyltransferase [Enterobacter cloacae complex sp. S4]MBJ6420450.1 site-specific DNA-methyltransferase [Enterobacter roggenkampii]MCU3130208.1 site-specific DNA-methyltransferase [Enterobacter roggenkampii]
MKKQSKKNINEYLSVTDRNPLLLQGDALSVLKLIPDSSVNCVITSPPYWLQREYESGGLGQERKKEDYIASLLLIFSEIKRVLTNDGSFWLNINDTYNKKSLSGIPWRVAIAMMDEQDWILRNDIIWNKLKGGMDSSKDRLNNIHENIFHFVKNAKYYYNIDAIRTTSRKASIKNGAVVSATGITGVNYKRRIELSTTLSDEEKNLAFTALENILEEIAKNKISDFRMVIRGQHRITHSDSEKISGRARELRDKGFYFLKYHPKGSKPSDVWEIPPEDAQKRGAHFAPYPEEVCIIPILSTCPPNGIVLDPFVGTGTTTAVACKLGYRSIGIDISKSYLNIAEKRVKNT